MKDPRVLIVCTQPYNPSVQSRALDSYLHFFQKEDLRQIFSDSRTPIKGQCASLYQITDRRLIERRLKRATKVGKVFDYDSLPDCWDNNKSFKRRRPKHKKGLYRLVRKAVWKKKLWDTPELEKWVKEFSPDCILLWFSGDFFVFDIATHFADKYELPIILCITDDYVFNGHFSLSPFYWAYRYLYKKMIRNLMKKRVLGMFESNRIQSKYLEHFDIPSHVQYICTNITPAAPSIPTKIDNLSYFGNMEFGRFDSLCEVARAFLSQGAHTKIHVYTANYEVVKNKKRPINLILHKPIPYEEVQKKIKEADMLLVVEGMKKEDVKNVRYSLSTKVGDSLASGKPILAYGGKDTGAMSFFMETESALLATNQNELNHIVSKILSGDVDYRKIIGTALATAKEKFNLENQAKLYKERLIEFLEKRKPSSSQ